MTHWADETSSPPPQEGFWLWDRKKRTIYLLKWPVIFFFFLKSAISFVISISFSCINWTELIKPPRFQNNYWGGTWCQKSGVRKNKLFKNHTTLRQPDCSAVWEREFFAGMRGLQIDPSPSLWFHSTMRVLGSVYCTNLPKVTPLTSVSLDTESTPKGTHDLHSTDFFPSANVTESLRQDTIYCVGRQRLSRVCRCSASEDDGTAHDPPGLVWPYSWLSRFFSSFCFSFCGNIALS